MKFWTVIRSAGWVSTIGGYAYAVMCMYQAANYYAWTSVAGSKEYVTVGCIGDCVQQKAASQSLVIGLTMLGAIVLLSAMCGLYIYMKPSLDRIAELKAQSE